MDAYVRAWSLADLDREGGVQEQRFETRSSANYALAISPSGRRVVVGGADFLVHVLDGHTLKEEEQLEGHLGLVKALCFAGRDDTVVSGSLEGHLRCWRLQGEKNYWPALTDAAVTVALSPDGRRLVAGGGHWRGADHPGLALAVHDVVGSSPPVPLVGHKGMYVTSASFHPDGRRVATAAFPDRFVRIWDAESGAQLHTIDLAAGGTATLFTKDGRLLITAGADRLLRLWDTETWEEKGSLKGCCDVVMRLRLHPDGRRVVSCSGEKAVRMWDLVERKELFHFSHAQKVMCAVVSGDGKTGASCDIFGGIRLWDPETGAERRVLTGHKGGTMVLTVAFLQDGRWLISTGQDGTVRIWDVASGLEFARFDAHAGAEVGPLALTADEMTLYTGGRDGFARAWNLGPLSWLRGGLVERTQNLTRAWLDDEMNVRPMPLQRLEPVVSGK